MQIYIFLLLAVFFVLGSFLLSMWISKFLDRRLDKIFNNYEKDNLLYHEKIMFHTIGMAGPALIIFSGEELRIIPVIGQEHVIPMKNILARSAGQWRAYSKVAWWRKEIIRIQNTQNNKAFLLGVKNKEIVLNILQNK